MNFKWHELTILLKLIEKEQDEWIDIKHCAEKQNNTFVIKYSADMIQMYTDMWYKLKELKDAL